MHSLFVINQMAFIGLDKKSYWMIITKFDTIRFFCGAFEIWSVSIVMAASKTGNLLILKIWNK